MDRARPIPRWPCPLFRGRLRRRRSQCRVHVSHRVHGRPRDRTRHPFNQHAGRDCAQAVLLRLPIQYRSRVARLHAASDPFRRIRRLGVHQPSRLARSWPAVGSIDCHRGSAATDFPPDERSHSGGCMVWEWLVSEIVDIIWSTRCIRGWRSKGLSRGRGLCWLLTSATALRTRLV